MIISISHEFMFIHVYKTAGLAIDKILGRFGLQAQVELPRLFDAVLETILVSGVDPAVLSMNRHSTALELREKMRRDTYNKLFKFAFVRNPWDLQLSLYHFNVAFPEHLSIKSRRDFSSFESYIMSLDETPHPTGQQLRFLADESGNLIVDYVGRFETLAKDFSIITKRIGMPLPPLQKVNATIHDPWPTYYNLEMFERVRTRCAIDIQAFGYDEDPMAYGIS